jgi:hypothetical protein
MFYFLLTQVFATYKSVIVWNIDDNIFQNLLHNLKIAFFEV